MARRGWAGKYSRCALLHLTTDWKPIRVKTQRGIALFLVLSISLILFILGMSLVYFVRNRKVAAPQTLDGIRARLAAQSAAEIFLLKLKHLPYEFWCAYESYNNGQEAAKEWEAYVKDFIPGTISNNLAASGVNQIGVDVTIDKEGRASGERYVIIQLIGWAKSNDVRANYAAEYYLRYRQTTQ